MEAYQAYALMLKRRATPQMDVFKEQQKKKDRYHLGW